MTRRILLIQARDTSDAMLGHELDCFARRCGLATDAFRSLNLCCDTADATALAEVDAVMIGGSGDYSLATGGFPWHHTFLELMREVARRDVPTFASCFGFQALVQALGGRVVKEPSAAEVGTFRITLSDAGQRDPLFGRLPGVFDAQLGHNDSVRDLPPELERLAYSDRCEVQAVRVRGTNVVATQFHPELTMEDNITRYVRYLHVYDAKLGPDEAQAMAAAIHRPSPLANALLSWFIEGLPQRKTY